MTVRFGHVGKLWSDDPPAHVRLLRKVYARVVRKNYAFFSKSLTTPVKRSTVSVSASFSAVPRDSRTPAR